MSDYVQAIAGHSEHAWNGVHNLIQAGLAAKHAGILVENIPVKQW